MGELSLAGLERAEAACGTYPFQLRIRDLLQERRIPMAKMAEDTGMARRLFYPDKDRKRTQPTRATLMACAYYFGVTVEEMVEGTDAAARWYGLWEE